MDFIRFCQNLFQEKIITVDNQRGLVSHKLLQLGWNQACEDTRTKLRLDIGYICRSGCNHLGAANAWPGHLLDKPDSRDGSGHHQALSQQEQQKRRQWERQSSRLKFTKIINNQNDFFNFSRKISHISWFQFFQEDFQHTIWFPSNTLLWLT